MFDSVMILAISKTTKAVATLAIMSISIIHFYGTIWKSRTVEVDIFCGMVLCHVRKAQPPGGCLS